MQNKITDLLSKMKEGNLLGNPIKTNEDGSLMMELPLPTDTMFKKVHGEMKLHYTVYPDKKIILQAESK